MFFQLNQYKTILSVKDPAPTFGIFYTRNLNGGRACASRIHIYITMTLIIFLLSAITAWEPVFAEITSDNNLTKPVYQIVIRVAERKLRLYGKNEEGTMTLIREYDVATAIKGLKPQPMGAGRITKIDFAPNWYPPPITRATFREKGIDLPSVVPPHHPLNFMGAFKIHLSHCTERGCFYRIHGNNDRSKIGKRVTGGCVRMYNEEGMEMARLVPIGTEVLFEP